MRLPRVVVSVALIVALALVVVPASVGSRTPSAPLAIDPAQLQPIEVGSAARGTTAATTPDPAYRSTGAIDSDDAILDPADGPEAPVRPAVDSPNAPVAFVPIATPKPTPRPTPRPVAAAPPSGGSGGGSSGSGGSSGGSGGGGSTGGDWNYDPEISWYGPGLYGNRTACGQTYTESILGVAHRSLPCGTKVTFKNGSRIVTVPVIDRGPYVAGRTWDLSRAACVALNHCYTGPIYWRYP